MREFGRKVRFFFRKVGKLGNLAQNSGVFFKKSGKIGSLLGLRATYSGKCGRIR